MQRRQHYCDRPPPSPPHSASTLPFVNLYQDGLVTIVVIGTPENVDTYTRDQHLRSYAKTYEWSKPQPAPDGSNKVLIALNRIMV